jgi:large subunit ribosomal protein L29
MNADKIRNLTDAELVHQQTELADTLFKLKFQLKMGQTESLKKIRDLKKDIARIKTIEREKQLAGGNGAVKVKAGAPVAKAAKATKAPKVAKAPKVLKAKKAASKTKTAATEKK